MCVCVSHQLGDEREERERESVGVNREKGKGKKETIEPGSWNQKHTAANCEIKKG